MRSGRLPQPVHPRWVLKGSDAQSPTLLPHLPQLSAMAFSPAPTKSRPVALQLTQLRVPRNPPFPAFNSKAGSSSPGPRPVAPGRAILRRHGRGVRWPPVACLLVKRETPERAPLCFPLTLGFIHQLQEAVSGASREGAGLRGAPPRNALASRPRPAPPEPGSRSARGSGGRGGAERPDQWWAVGRAAGRGAGPGPAARGVGGPGEWRRPRVGGSISKLVFAGCLVGYRAEG